MSNLAESYSAGGRPLEALKLNEETLRLRKAKLGLDHPDTLASMNNLAKSYVAAGRILEALKLQEETLRLKKTKLGPDHPDTLLSMNNLAASYLDAGRTEEALKLFEETLHLQKAKLGPAHPDTLRSMNNLASSYIAAGRVADALSILMETLARRQQRVAAAPSDSVEQLMVACTHGQIGEANQFRHDYAAAIQAYAKSVELFEKLEQAGALKQAFFRGRFNVYRQQMVLCRKAEHAVKDLDFALKQPAADVAGLLDIRVQALAAHKDQAGVVATAEAYAKLAQKDTKLIYNAACAWSLASGLAKTRGADAAPLVEEFARKALTLLKQATTGEGQFFATPAALAAHMKNDTDLGPLRGRDDFKKLISELDTRPQANGR
jgi:tetratricopeptide (TPR) repeat protein